MCVTFFFVLLRPTHRIWLSRYTLTSGLFGNRTHYITAFPLNMHFTFLSFVSFIGSLWWSFVKSIVEIIIQISSHISVCCYPWGASEVIRGEERWSCPHWCLFMWSAKWSDREKQRPQWWHLKGLAPVCFLKWRVSSSERANLHSQPSQEHRYGFSPVMKKA